MQYIQAVENGADLVRCRDEDSQANCNILAGEERATCESKIKFCTCHTIEVEQAGSTLGYIPQGFFVSTKMVRICKLLEKFKSKLMMVCGERKLHL